MCFSKPKIPTVETPPEPPRQPRSVDLSVTQARNTETAQARAAAGRSGTVMTSGLSNSTPANTGATGTRTVLG